MKNPQLPPRAFSKSRHFQDSSSSTENQISFQAAMSVHGLFLKGNIPDGNIHRFHVKGDSPGTRNGWYILFRDGMGGIFGCWKQNFFKYWFAGLQQSLTAEERASIQIKISEARKEREIEEFARREAGAIVANNIWDSCIAATDDHPYLANKCVRNHGLRSFADKLVLPLLNIEDEIRSLQFIDPLGQKRFLPNGQKRGCSFLIGKVTNVVGIAEGYATAASVYEMIGHPVLVAFDAGNLEPVARAVRSKHPDLDIIIIADNDAHTHGNPGVTKAISAASAVNGKYIIPPIPGDFNDVYRGFKK